MPSSAQGSDLAVTRTGRSHSRMCTPVPVTAWLQTGLQEALSLAELELLEEVKLWSQATRGTVWPETAHVWVFGSTEGPEVSGYILSHTVTS